MPNAVLGLPISSASDQVAAQDNAVAEEEDENSDLNLKFLTAPSTPALPVLAFHYLFTLHPGLPGFIEEIPTPPPPLKI